MTDSYMIRKSLPLLLLVTVLLALPTAQASFVSHPEALSFVQEMEERHGFDRGELLDALHRASHNERVIRLIQPPSQPGTRSWRNY
ncbi:hypothetical protein RZS08_31555, partial [Arthrospira platensis SPKY1]|nr:hypothetical protein [Arthrospira platensis SPKY1]